MMAALGQIGRALILAMFGVAGAAHTAAAAGEAPQAALIADEIAYDAETGVVIARGAVEVYFRERTLTADEIVYDSRADRISASGAITLRTETGETVFADVAELDASLRDGLIQGARGVIAGSGKIAALEARRLDGRYNVLEKAVFSPCEVCADRPVPLWRIRADRIVHDQQERRIHYQNAYLDVFGVPVAFLPYFRHPSPEVKRATGFLAPEASRDRAYGVGVKAPYHIVLDDYSDLTLTPFIATSDGAILETEYRRRFESGWVDLNVNFGVTDYGDDGKGARARIGVFGTGRFALDDGVYAGFDAAFASDDAFLRRYDYTERDRLESEAFVRAYDGRNFASTSVSFVQSLRAGETQGGVPIAAPEISARYVTDAPVIGGELGLTLDAVALLRTDGRDVFRASLGADWSRQAITSGGLVLRGFADARADLYQISDDAAFSDGAARFSPRAGVEARMPFVRVGDDGATHILEPIIQFTIAPDVTDGDIPNEDSVIVEFDEMNLFETDRFTGADRRETGAYATIGARYERIDPGGFSFRASGGRILRLDETLEFSSRSGLDGDASDYVAAASFGFADWLEFGTRWRLSDEFGVNRAEIGGRVDYAPLSVFGYYLFVEDDPAESAFGERSEISVGAALALDRNWTVSGDVKRDLIVDKFVTAGGRLSYEDECAGLDLYVRKRFTESVNDPGGTSFGLQVRLFGAGDQSKASGACAYGAR